MTACRMNVPGLLVDSILEAVFIVSPKMENLGSLKPTRPVTCDESPVVTTQKFDDHHKGP